MIDSETGEIKKGQITAELKRGVMTYRCSCGSMRLRPFNIEGYEDDREPLMGITCIQCGAYSRDKWKELRPVDDVKLRINGSCDDNFKLDNKGEAYIIKKR